MHKDLVVIDFETDNLDTSCSPIQFGAIAIDGIRLQIIPNSEFYSWCRPDDINDGDYIERHKNTLAWHCKNYNLSMDDLISKINGAPSEKQVFENFVEYLKKYHTKESGQTKFTAPALAGYNALAFDFPILDRLCQKYGYLDKNGQQNLYFTRDTQDIMKVVMLWLAPTRDLKSYSMDAIRDYLGLPIGQSHDALFDVRQEADILIRFLKLHARLAKQIKFQNSFAKEESHVS